MKGWLGGEGERGSPTPELLVGLLVVAAEDAGEVESRGGDALLPVRTLFYL